MITRLFLFADQQISIEYQTPVLFISVLNDLSLCLRSVLCSKPFCNNHDTIKLPSKVLLQPVRKVVLERKNSQSQKTLSQRLEIIHPTKYLVIILLFIMVL